MEHTKTIQELTDFLDFEIAILADEVTDKLFPLPENKGWKKGDPVKTIPPACEIQRVLNFDTKNITYKIAKLNSDGDVSDIEESCCIAVELGGTKAITELKEMLSKFESRFIRS